MNTADLTRPQAPGSPRAADSDYLAWSSKRCESIDVEVSIEVEAKKLWSSAKRHRRIDQVGQAFHGVPVHHGGEVLWRYGGTVKAITWLRMPSVSTRTGSPVVVRSQLATATN